MGKSKVIKTFLECSVVCEEGKGFGEGGTRECIGVHLIPLYLRVALSLSTLEVLDTRSF